MPALVAPLRDLHDWEQQDHLTTLSAPQKFLPLTSREIPQPVLW
jgi:hypothetical protein